MIKKDEQALICDLAEVYKIYDYRQAPLSLIATLSCGLKPNSRIKLAMAGERFSIVENLMIGILDRLTLLVYSKTKDAEKGRNKPKLLGDQLSRQKEQVQTFNSGKDFECMKEFILRG